MERHSYGSNIRICTNIRVTDPSMVTAKTAWQDGTQLDFGSVVDKDKVVEYGFAITNNGQENLHNLTFTDNDIGVTLDPTNGLKVTGSRVYDVTDKDEDTALEASDLTAVVSHPNYADINVSFASDEELNAFLANLTVPATTAAALDDNVFSSGSGLPVGYTVTIRGIGYMLSDAQIGDGVFDNTVLTTSTNKTVSETLYGQASMRVFVPADPMYYQWAGHDLSVTKTKLISDIMGAIADPNNPLYDKDSLLRADNVNKIELVTKAGTAISSPYVTIDSSYNLTIKYDTTGSKVFYVKVTYNSSKNTVIIPVLVNVTSVQDSVYVLDYGLSVDLTQNNELTKNDTLTVPGRATTSEIIAIGSDGAYSKNEITFTSDDDVIDKIYGTFTLNGQTLTYLPDAFMEDVDTIQVAVNVYESDTEPSKITGTLDINNEVEMYKSITVLPANVVYYEDCFPAIEYKVTADKMDQTVNSITSLTQSADQDQEYGQDAAYQNNSDKSAGALTTITIQDSTIVASFEFKGTGFELIGRTNTAVGNGNTDGSATMTVKVLDKNGTVKNIPVITEFDNGGDGGDEEIYQVPVIRVKDLTLDTYTVQISGVPARDYDTLDANGNPTVIPSYLYVDGLRIFQPLGDKNEYYNASENGAQFIEIRDEIVEGNILAVDKSNTAITISGGTSTWTENLDQANELGTDGNIISYNEVSSVDDYLLKGPNNEVYLNGYNKDSAIVLYVKEIGTGAHNLQLALRAVDYGKFFIGEETGTNAVVNYGISGDNDTFAWKELIKATSSTEQYYTINYNECPYIEDKSAYQIVIQIGDVSMASFTSLKLTGLELVSAGGEPATMRYNNGTLEKLDPVEGTWETADALSAPAFYAISAQMSSDVIVGEDEPDTPAEDLPTDEPETETPETDVPAEPETPTVPEDKPEDKPENNGRPSNSDVSKTYRKLLEILRRLMAR